MNETNKFEAEDLNSISRVEFGIIYLHALSNIWDNATEIVLKSMATSLLQGLTSTVTFFAFKSIEDLMPLKLIYEFGAVEFVNRQKDYQTLTYYIQLFHSLLILMISKCDKAT